MKLAKGILRRGGHHHKTGEKSRELAAAERSTGLIMSWIFIFLILFALLGVGVWLARAYLTGGSAGGLFGAARERRIGVSEVANVDARRKLLLIYRDGVEHLVMTGGPIDVVIEQGIGQQRRQAQFESRPQQPQLAPVGAAPPAAPTLTVGPAAAPVTESDQPGALSRLRQRLTPNFDQK